MLKLEIKNFSCIANAVIDFSRLTVIIGPQASGKSVISKLAYFCYNIIHSTFAPYSEAVSIEALQQAVASNFAGLFPASAWGAAQFEIVLTAGKYRVQISRSRTKNPSVRVEFSEYFRELHREFIDALVVARSTESARTNTSQRGTVEFNVSNEFNRRLGEDLEESYFSHMLFVPAGRSFFVNTAKMSAVEISKSIDSITATFGRTYKMFQDGSLPYVFHRAPASRNQLANAINTELFGGRVRISKEGQWVDAADGRTIPFSALSSGQQELLPLWLMINFYAMISEDGCLNFIEEPEAHLFPRAQSLLTTYLCSIVAHKKTKGAMLITTHSPYLLAKLNNLLYADSLSTRFPRRRKAIAGVIDQTAWISSQQVNAYAIDNRQVVSITDDDGLIDAAFLDSVSGDIAKEYGQLLDLDESWSNAR